MNATELAALVAAGAAVLGVVVLAVFLARIDRTVRDVGRSVQQLRFESVPIEARGELAPREYRLPRSRAPRSRAALVAKVARANPVLDVSDPVIKVLALASGTGEAARRFRRTRRER